MKQKSALITGATGFIGLELCALLKRKGWAITAIGRSRTEGPWSQFYQCDLAEPDSSLPDFNVDAVFHLAGKAHALSEISEGKEAYFNINVRATERLVGQASKARSAPRFIYISSVKAMGEGNADYNSKAPISENFPTYPSGPYGLSKLKAEEAAFQYPKSTVIRPTMVYGPRSKGNLLKMAQAISKNRFPPIPEFGNLRSMVNVSDLCELALLAANSENAIGQTYIAAEPEAYSTRTLYEMICSSLGKEPAGWSIPHAALKLLGSIGNLLGSIRGKRFIFDSDALDKLRSSAWYDGSKCCNELGFEYKRHLRAELPKIVGTMS